MKISLKYYGGSRDTRSSLIEMIVESSGTTIIADITNLDGSIDEEFISNLREIADDFSAQNELVYKKRNQIKNNIGL